MMTKRRPYLKDKMRVLLPNIYSNLLANCIKKSGNNKNSSPIIVTWNGHTDKDVLKRLNIQHLILIITCYKINNN